MEDPKAKKYVGKVVFANGVFDLLHEGHLALLKFAKSLGDTLVVGINSDRVTKMLKGPDRPIHNERERKAALEKVPHVDDVVIFDELRTTEIVRKLRPHIVVKGAEYPSSLVRETDLVPEDIEIVMAPLLFDESGKKISTTTIIEKRKKGAV